MKILVIDDDPLMLQYLTLAVERMGFKAVAAHNGEIALDILQNDTINVIVCDVVMPKISGNSLVNILRTIYHINTPVLMISSLKDSLLLTKSLDWGANGFLEKPFNLQQLKERIINLISTTKNNNY